MNKTLNELITIAVCLSFIMWPILPPTSAAAAQDDKLAPSSGFSTHKDGNAELANKSAGPFDLEDIPIPEKSVGIDTAKADKWIRDSTEEYRGIKEKLINKVRHVPFSEFCAKLAAAIDKFNEILRADSAEYAVLLDNETHKSRRWVYNIVKKKLARQPVWTSYQFLDMKHPGFFNLLNKKHGKLPKKIVIFDDAAYSGNTLRQSITIIKKQYSDLGLNPPRIIIVIPFITETAIELLKKHGINVEEDVLFVEKMETIREMLDEKEIEIFRNMRIKEDLYGCLDDTKTTLTYFDHKTPDQLSFFAGIREILGLNRMVDTPYKREGIKCFEEEEKEYSDQRIALTEVSQGEEKLPMVWAEKKGDAGYVEAVERAL